MQQRNSKKGITRVKKGTGYAYYQAGKLLQSPATVKRINSLAIPPSWTDVWISSNNKAHLQATGKDLAGRKQYRYHSSWTKRRSEKKYHHQLAFGKKLPNLRKQVNSDIRQKEWNAEKVIAIAIRLLENSHIRIGSSQYEKLYRSYGLTTLQDQHLTIKQGKARIAFKGKKGIPQQQIVKDKKLVSLIARCREMPGKRLLQYYTSAGKRKAITSTQVNKYIQDACGNGFTAKDFRTWAGSIHALKFWLNNHKNSHALQEMLQHVSEQLGNTSTICRKYYIHPCVMKLYEENENHTNIAIHTKHLFGKTGLSSLEKKLLQLLKKDKQ